VSIVFYVALTIVSQNILADSIAAVGLMIAFYYGLTGFACVWFYRKTLTKTRRDIVMRGALPLIGGVMLFAAFIYALKSYAAPDWLTDDNGNNVAIFGYGAVAVVGVLAMILGLVLMIVWRFMAPDYFPPGEPLQRRSHHEYILALATEDQHHLRLPDSGLPDVVIAPDLSNLPEGARVIDLETGRDVTDQLEAERAADRELDLKAAEGRADLAKGDTEQKPDTR